MKIIVRDIAQYVPVTSHIIQADPLHPDMMNAFHCWKCGRMLFQFNGTVILSEPGPTRAVAPHMHLCHSCKHRHLVSSIL